MKKYLVLFILLFPLFTYGQQNVTFEKKNFKNNIKGLDKAMDSMAAGDAYYYNKTITDNYLAVPYYLSAEKFNPENDELNYKIGVCMLSHNSPFKREALVYLLRAYKINPDVAPDIHYQLGMAYQLNLNWEDAKKEYNAYLYSAYLLTLDKKQNAIEIADAKKKIEECNNGEILVQHPVKVLIENLGPNINSLYPEYGVLVNADETEMIFTSKRPNTTGKGMDEGTSQYMEDIYISFFENGAWTPASNSGTALNSSDNDATAGISPDGQTLYIYRGIDGGDIYEAHLNGKNWTKPIPMSNKINSSYFETSVSMGPDGKTLYLVSERPGGYGGRDIYKIVADSSGTWGDAQNLGPVINTQYNEEGIDIQADGKTLYFSSEGHNTMGGYDIFRSVCDSGHWSVPENIGYPVNTPDDDVFFCISASGKHGYYSSVRKGGYGEKDIYRITFLSDSTNKKPSKSSRLTLVKGVIEDSATHKPVEASIEISDNKKDSVVARFKSNRVTGKYLVALPSGINYGMAITAPGYLFYSINFDLPDTATFMEESKNIPLQPLTVGSSIVLRNIFYNFNKASLRKESKSELRRLIQLLNSNPNLKIEISGYTDNRGSDEYNQRLSESRAKSVVDYLEEHGIDSGRLTYKGYGKNNPIATNETEKGRQLNRRTEFKIIGT